MASHFRIQSHSPQVAAGVFIARNATVLGDVALGAGCSVWFQAVIRGDVEAIRIGDRTNIQDGAVLHADPGFPCDLGAGVTVGHRAVIHGARVGDHAMIGMGAILLNGCVIGEACIVGAGALVPSNRVFPPKSLILGTPAKVVRSLTEDEVAGLAESAAHYVAAGLAYIEAGLDHGRH
ncbi:MAG: gamma carbonic anhydrase family protein [Myxococcota bacterium]